jgi:hypothetical protein
MLFEDDISEDGVGSLPGDEDTLTEGGVGSVCRWLPTDEDGGVVDNMGDSFVGEVLTGIWWDGVDVCTGCSADEGVCSLLWLGRGDSCDVVSGKVVGGMELGTEGGNVSGTEGGSESGIDGGRESRGGDSESAGRVDSRSLEVGGVDTSDTIFLFCCLNSGLCCVGSRGNSAGTSSASSASGGGTAGTVGGGKSGRLEIDSEESLKV